MKTDADKSQVHSHGYCYSSLCLATVTSFFGKRPAAGLKAIGHSLVNSHHHMIVLWNLQRRNPSLSDISQNRSIGGPCPGTVLQQDGPGCCSCMSPQHSRSRPQPGLCMHAYILGGPPHPVIVTIGENGDNIRVLLYSYYTTITGWGVLLAYIPRSATLIRRRIWSFLLQRFLW